MAQAKKDTRLARAAVNIHGPNGEFVLAGEPLPKSLPKWFVESLLATGGAVEESE